MKTICGPRASCCVSFCGLIACLVLCAGLAHAADDDALSTWQERLKLSTPAELDGVLGEYRKAVAGSIAPVLAQGEAGRTAPDSPAGRRLLLAAQRHVLLVIEEIGQRVPAERAHWLRLALTIHAALGDGKAIQEFASRYVDSQWVVLGEAAFAATLLEEVATCSKDQRNAEAAALLREFIRFSAAQRWNVPNEALPKDDAVGHHLAEVSRLLAGDAAPVLAARQDFDLQLTVLFSLLLLDRYPQCGPVTSKIRLLLGRTLVGMGHGSAGLPHLKNVAAITWDPDLQRDALDGIQAQERHSRMSAEERAFVAAQLAREAEIRRLKRSLALDVARARGEIPRAVVVAPLPVTELPKTAEEATALLKHKDVAERRRGQYALAALGAKAVPALLAVAAGEDQGAQQAADQVLRGLDGPEYVDALLRAAKDKKLADTVYVRMGRLRSPEALAKLAKAAADEKVPYPERQGLIEAMTETETDAAREALIALAKDPNERIRRVALRGLAHFKGKDVADILIGAIKDTSPQVVKQAIESIGRHGDASAVPKLIEIIRRPANDEAAVFAIRALGEIGGTEAEAALRKELANLDQASGREQENYRGAIERALRAIEERRKREGVSGEEGQK